MYFDITYPPSTGARIPGVAALDRPVPERDPVVQMSTVQKPGPQVDSMGPGERAVLLRALMNEAHAAPNALEFRKAIALKLSAKNLAPRLRRELMNAATDLYRARGPHRPPPPAFGSPSLPAPLSKAVARGGMYHKRITHPGGKHEYVYSEEEYQQRSDAHVDGVAARTNYLKTQVERLLDKCKDQGCPIEHFRGLVRVHGHQAVADALRSLNVSFDGKTVRSGRAPEAKRAAK